MKKPARSAASLGIVLAGMLLAAVAADTQGVGTRPRLVIPVSRSEVVSSKEDIHTVAIADPHIADAAVGSARTVIVTGKSPGTTSLVVYTQGGVFTNYDVQVFQPNSGQQVLLRVRVAEVTEEAKKELGFDWYAKGGVPGMAQMEGGLFTAKVADPHMPLQVGSETNGIASITNPAGDFFLQASWKALEQKGAVRVLANPSLLARSGEKAHFLAGGEFPVPIATGGGGVGVLPTITIEWKKYGVQVDFTPTVEEDSSITLQVAPEVSALDFTNSLRLAGYVVPAIIARSASTTVHLSSGEHLVIGGLHQTDRIHTVRKVPVLGSIPLLGALFSSTSTDSTNRELLLVVSPELITGASPVLPELPTERPEHKQ